jgi:KTSC domain-containing protein
MSKIYPLRSSHLTSAEHTGSDLIITFKDGSRHRYSGVPAATMTELLRAKSPGRFLFHAISGKYKSKKLSEYDAD